MTALVVTPADVAWYLSIFPDGRKTIKALKNAGKIVVIKKVSENNARSN